MQYQLHKAGAILLSDRKILLCRSRGKEFFVAPGGKVEQGETPIQALRRELQEELSLAVDEGYIKDFSTFYAPAAENEKNMLRMDVFMVENWQGNPRPSSEIEEIAWVGSEEAKTMKIGSIFSHEVIPRLKNRGILE